MFELTKFDVKKYDAILDKGLSLGLGDEVSSMCIEAAICRVLNLPHGDDPGCVADSVRQFKIKLNDQNWSSKQARAKGLRDLGLAQLGSLGIVNDGLFFKRLLEEIIGQLIPDLFRTLYPTEFVDLVKNCEINKDHNSVLVLHMTLLAIKPIDWKNGYSATYSAINHTISMIINIANKYNNKFAAADAADAIYYANTAMIDTGYYVQEPDKYLILVAKIALDILKELKSPGCALLY